MSDVTAEPRNVPNSFALSVKFKVGVAAVLCLTASGVGMLLDSGASYRKNVALVEQQSLQFARTTFDNLIAADTGKLSVATELLMSNREVREAFAAKDRPKLLALTAPILERLKPVYGITNFNFLDEKEIRFLCVQEPENPKLMGTKAVRFNVQESARTKDWSTGLSLGFSGFALRATHPLWDNGRIQGDKLMGYLELGSEIGGFIKTMKNLSGNEYGLLIRKQALKPEMWGDQRKKNGLHDNWNDLPNLVVGTNTWKDEAIFAYAGDVSSLPDQGIAIDEISGEGKIFARGVFPIKDASGTKVGGVFVLTDITQIKEQFSASKQRTIATTVGLTLVICLVILFLLSRLVFRRLAAITQVATRLVGGDYRTPAVVHKNDEIGRFEALFEQLRLIFVNLIEDYECLASKPGKDQSTSE